MNSKDKIERHNAIAAHANALETLSEQFIDGTISDIQLLCAQMQSCLNTLKVLTKEN
jgi:hypothetical protein